MGFDLSGGGECIPLLYPSCIAHRQGEEHSLLSPPAEGGWDFTLQYWEIFLAQTFEKATVAVKSWVFFYKKCWQVEVWNCAQFSLSSFPEDRIDHDSPLYSFGPEDLKTKRIEIVIWLSGTRSKTGTAISGTASYTSDEIVWGGRSVVPVVL